MLCTFTSAIAACLALAQPIDATPPPERLSIATFNIWVGGQNALPDKAASRELTLAAMRSLNADILAIQEQKGFANDYAAALGYNVLVQDDSTAILTRLEILSPSKNTWGAKLRTAQGSSVWVFNIHFPAAPYQPYQLAGIEYHDGRFITTAADAITEARLARGEPALRALRDMQPALREPDALVIIAGDFNEPSHLDWTQAATAAWQRTGPIDWPTTRLFTDAGLADAFRTLHPDPLAKPGFTWTPRPEPRDVMDRIDLVLFANTGPSAATNNAASPTNARTTNPPSTPTTPPTARSQITHAGNTQPTWRVINAQVAGEPGTMTDLIINPWPSDHRAVRIELERATPPTPPTPQPK
jgi:exodeoxyribonuclease III